MTIFIERIRERALQQPRSLALFASAIILLAACAPATMDSSAQDEVDLFSYLPGPASVVGWVDLEDLQRHPARRAAAAATGA